MVKETQIGVVSNYFDRVGVAAIKLTGKLKVGEVIRIVGGDVDFEQPVDEIQIHREEVLGAKKGDEVGIKVDERVWKGYRVFRV